MTRRDCTPNKNVQLQLRNKHVGEPKLNHEVCLFSHYIQKYHWETLNCHPGIKTTLGFLILTLNTDPSWYSIGTVFNLNVLEDYAKRLTVLISDAWYLIFTPPLYLFMYVCMYASACTFSFKFISGKLKTILYGLAKTHPSLTIKSKK